MPEELIPIVLFISIAAVAIFRPITTKIGYLLQKSHEQKTSGQDPQVARMMQLMERMVDRMDRLEDRVDFTERMLERQRTQGMLSEGPMREEPERSRGEGRARQPEDI
jgi:hypothetical protein